MLRIILALSLTLSACASKRLQTPADLVSTTYPVALEISAEVVPEYTDAYNVVLQINFESKDGQWVRIDKADLDLNNDDGVVQNIIIGKDLSCWLQAKAEEKKIRSQNEDMGSLGFASAGAALLALGIVGKDANATAAGAVTTAGVSGYLLRKEYRDAKNAAQQPAWVPETHLYAPFTVPSMSLVKRWVLINTPSGRVNKFAVLNLKTVEGENLVYKIRVGK